MQLVYKYLPPPDPARPNETFLSNFLLRMTQPDDLNDPFECIPFCLDFDQKAEIRASAERLRGRLDQASANRAQEFERINVGEQIELAKAENPLAKREFIRRWYKDCFLPGPNHDVGIVSFSRRWNSSTMWAHYGQKHTGYCVGFDRQHRAFNYAHPKIRSGSMHDVKYLETRPLHKPDDDELNLILMAFTKSADWTYEQEFRVLYALEDATECHPAPAASRSGLPICLRRYDPATVKELLIGYRTDDELSTRVIKLAGNRQIPVYRVAISSTTSFDMEREPVNEFARENNE